MVALDGPRFLFKVFLLEEKVLRQDKRTLPNKWESYSNAINELLLSIVFQQNEWEEVQDIISSSGWIY